MTRIEIDPSDLESASRLYLATADSLRSTASSLLTYANSYGVAPSIAGIIRSGLEEASDALRRVVSDLDSEAQGLALIAGYVRNEMQAGADEVALTEIDDLLGAIKLMADFAEHEGLTEVAAARMLLKSGSAADEFLTGLRPLGQSAAAIGTALDFYLAYEQTGDWFDAGVIAGATYAGGKLGGMAAAGLCGVFIETGPGIFVCIAVGGMIGAALGNKAAQPTYLGPLSYRKLKIQTASGYLPIEEKLMEMESREGLAGAKATRIKEYLATGQYTEEEAIKLAELEYPDLVDAQLGP